MRLIIFLSCSDIFFLCCFINTHPYFSTTSVSVNEHSVLHTLHLINITVKTFVCFERGTRGIQRYMSRMMRWVKLHQRHRARLPGIFRNDLLIRCKVNEKISSCWLLFRSQKKCPLWSFWGTSFLLSTAEQWGWACAVADHRIIDSGIWIHFGLSVKKPLPQKCIFLPATDVCLPRRPTRCIGKMDVFGGR